MQRLQPLKASLEGTAALVREFCLRKREVAGKPTFSRMLAQFFNEDVADWSRAVMEQSMFLRRYVSNFPTPAEAGPVPLPGFLRTREWLTKAEVTMTGVEENWLAARLAGTLNFRGEEAGKERKAEAGVTEDGERICTFYEREQRADGGYSFMDKNGFCNYVHMDKFGKVDKEKARRGGAGAEVAGKRPSERSGGGTGEKRQRKE